jgi:hypothetical protein
MVRMKLHVAPGDVSARTVVAVLQIRTVVLQQRCLVSNMLAVLSILVRGDAVPEDRGYRSGLGAGSIAQWAWQKSRR